MSNIIDKIQISGQSYNVKDSSAATVVELTQQEYDNLPSSAKTSNTLFVITDAQAGDLTQYWTSAQTNSAITEATSGKVDSSSVVTAVTSASTDSEIPTAKAVWDVASQGGGGGGKAIEAGRYITVTTGETADTVSFNMNIGMLTGNTNSVALQGWEYGTGNTKNSNTESGRVYSAVFLGGGNKNNGYSYGYSEVENMFIGSHNQINNTYGDNFTFPGHNVVIGEYNNITGDRLQNSIAIGYYNSGTTSYQLTCGYYNKTSNVRETSFGSYNNSVKETTTFGDSGNTLFSIGNGTADNARHNAFEVKQNGDIYLSYNGNDIKLQDLIADIYSKLPTPTGDTWTQYSAGSSIDANISGIRISSSTTIPDDTTIVVELTNSQEITIGSICTYWDELDECQSWENVYQIFDTESMIEDGPINYTDGYWTYTTNVTHITQLSLPFDIEVILDN